jgi:pilus assembly protein TadC
VGGFVQMISNLINFYEKHVSDDALVYKFVRKEHLITNILIITYFITAFLMIVAVLFAILKQVNHYGLVIPYFVNIILLIILIRIQVKKIKKIIEEKYGIVSENDKGWKNEKYAEKQFSIMTDYLNQKNLYSKPKIEQLIKMIHEDIEKKKIPSLITSSLLLTFVVPVWIQYVAALFRPNLTFARLNVVAISLVACIILFLIMLGIFKAMYFKIQNDILSEIFWKSRNLRKDILELLQEATLRIDDSEKNNSSHQRAIRRKKFTNNV